METHIQGGQFFSDNADFGILVQKKRFYASIDRTTTTGKKLFRKFNTRYLFMLHNLISSGMDIRTAIWECYNKLEVIK